MKFIALRSLRGEESRRDDEPPLGRDVDENEETCLQFVNPSLVIPLEDMWVPKKPVNGSSSAVAEGSEDNV